MIDVSEELRRPDHTAREFHDVDIDTLVRAHCACGCSATKADHQRSSRKWMQGHR